jgi:hypothetical protein
MQYADSLSAKHRMQDIAALYGALVEFKQNATNSGGAISTLADYIRSTRQLSPAPSARR